MGAACPSDLAYGQTAAARQKRHFRAAQPQGVSDQELARVVRGPAAERCNEHFRPFHAGGCSTRAGVCVDVGTQCGESVKPERPTLIGPVKGTAQASYSPVERTRL